VRELEAALMCMLLGIATTADYNGFEHKHTNTTEKHNSTCPPRQNISSVCELINRVADNSGNDDARRGYDAAQQAMTCVPIQPACLDVSYAAAIHDMQNISLDADVANGMRQWVYQTCTEFGYFQSSDGKNDSQPFGTLFPVEWWTKQCHDFYGIAPDAVATNIEQTNHLYGGLNYAGSRVFFVNGGIDPWHALSLPSNGGKADESDIT
jgi:hypothetical protein